MRFGDSCPVRFTVITITFIDISTRGTTPWLFQLSAPPSPCRNRKHRNHKRRKHQRRKRPTRPTRANPALTQRRNPHLLCVVGRVQDLLAIERSGAMRGRYFVLGRLLSPLEGVGAEELPLDALKQRVRSEQIAEVLVATPPSVDGEATALLLARELGPLGARVTRIASGVPHGGDLEFADQVTLGRAIEGRKSFG